MNPPSDNEPLAHSAHDGVGAQTYRAHVEAVVCHAIRFAREVAAFSPKWRGTFVEIVRIAALYHDLGKLAGFFQDVLRHNRKDSKGFNHCDAGTAYLLENKQFESALLAYSHHIGLPSIPEEKAKNANRKNLFLRDDAKNLEFCGATSLQRTAQFLGEYIATHKRIFPNEPPFPVKAPVFGKSNLARRLALSCIVDSDHGDTAQNYQKEVAIPAPALRAAERLDALDAYVEALTPPKDAGDARARARLALRRQIYTACRSRNLADSERIVSCDSPVGTGKTTAVMAHLLRVANERKLRRIFVVLPFTNIIDQSVEVYRKALVLPGEDPENVVAAHHHKVEFSGDNADGLRLLAQRWEAPIVVTTAVQFFETLAAKNTASLRKLHQVPGAAVFVDETHAAMPIPLWPQMWRSINELCDGWSCHFVLASGSLAQFWTLEDFVKPEEHRDVPRLIAESVTAPAFAAEKTRVRIATLHGEDSGSVSLEKLADAVLNAPGPRLVIFNTIQSAAAFAQHLRHAKGLGFNVEHLSTALSPADRNETLQRVREKLRADFSNWVLVATSCVEAGVDFSFHTGFRERASFSSTLQVLGRVSRNGEYDDAVVYDFQHDASELLSIHPHFKTSAKVLGQLLEKYKNMLTPEQCTEALQMEINQGTGDMEVTAEKIRQKEADSDFPEVAKLCRLITADTQTLVVNQELINRFLTGKREQFPSHRELTMHSVQVWKTKLKEMPVTAPLGLGGELVGVQAGTYDKFIGYMRGLLPVLNFKKGKIGNI